MLRGVSSGFVARVAAKVGINPSLLRLLCLFTAMNFAFHCMACYWWHVRRAAYELHDSEGSGLELGAFEDSDEMISRAVQSTPAGLIGISPLYALALFWSVTTSMGFEPPILPTTPAEQLYTVAVVLFGVMVTAFVVGSATKQRSDVGLIQGEEAVAQLAVGREAQPVARPAEGHRHRGDDTHRRRAAVDAAQAVSELLAGIKGKS